MSKITFILGGTKDSAKASSPSERMSQVDIDTKERMTVAIGNALRFLLKFLSLYKAHGPVIAIKVDDEFIGYVTKFTGKTFTEQFTTVNMEVLRIVMASRFTTEELLELKHSKDPLVNRISETFGHTGKSINIAGAEQKLNAKMESLKSILKYAKAEGVALRQKSTPKEVLAWEEKQNQERRLLNEAKKAAAQIEAAK